MIPAVSGTNKDIEVYFIATPHHLTAWGVQILGPVGTAAYHKNLACWTVQLLNRTGVNAEV